ncbi:MAG: aspartate carbamoyltransferase [Chloroflexi bacterium]|nr:aspartate carbamoyltransferase [Chloroflexota bacterium]
MTTLKGKDILRADQLTLDEIELIMQTAARFESVMRAGGRLTNMSGKVLATLFYEPSTRTRLSFESAMLRLGGQVISVAEARTSSSAAKGETLFDTGKMIESYADVAVIRHPAIGSAQELADGASIPVINGGDGAGQHPTQALLDLYTIRKEKGTVEGLTVTLAGDLKNGRTVHSLSALLANFGVRFYFVAPAALAMPTEITAGLRQRRVEIVETSDLAEAAAQSDVLYVTRVQRERFTDPAEYERLKGSYVVDLALVKAAKPGITLMHPLPRVDEIVKELDAYDGAAYFRQAANGVQVRMALLALVTGQA